MEKEKTPDIVRLFILIGFTIIVWVGIDIYFSFKKSSPLVVSESVVTQINPILDVKVLDEIEKRYNQEEKYLLEAQNKKEVVEKTLEEAVVEPIASPSAKIEASPTASPSNELSEEI